MEFIGYIMADTNRAILFQAHEWHAPDWMPKSQIAIHESEDTHEVGIAASAWICTQKGITEFEERNNAE